MSVRPACTAGIFLLGDDLPVCRLGFGAMRVTGPGVWGPPPDRAAALRLLRRAVDLGVTLIDTADAYGPGISEELIAEALHPYPKGLVIATKGGFVRPGPGQWAPVGRPEYLRQCVELSLRRLRLEQIPLWQLHRIDPSVPAEDQFAVLRALQEEGKIRHVGLSEVTVAQLEAARRVVDVASVQNRYSVGYRRHEDVLDYCAREGIAFLPWYPLDAGRLAGPDGPLAAAARQLGATPAQVALAWLLRRDDVVLPIPGTSRVEHLEENVAAAALGLPDDVYRVLDAGLEAA